MSRVQIHSEKYALASPEERRARLAELERPHIAPLTRLVEEIRLEQGLGEEVPFFDPRDGGTDAQALFLLEAPGPKARLTGFVSRDNPDPTASNFLTLLTSAGIARHVSLLWNIVPWYIGSGKKIRAARLTDISEGARYLARLLSILPKLQVVALVGRKAQVATSRVASLSNARIFHTLHPSNQVVTCWPEKRRQLQADLCRIREFLKSTH